ncbi:hypothetical protein [Pseudochrobactrum asaccharolyticum]|uniref:Uncharacterized protein n=1 Tax=Pseudochrobactrum asaccharolyticum TaxID=354351 RepID=A0A366DXV7_9HYPH|nr:hypothetical protein [Pseudochrobactrum asaccharolyticum]RBO94940.1 hypothetical protein DFR47_104302 [Pseudochrobactrum asaccharolyticum]
MDKYTKFVLTIIAGALSIIAFQNMSTPAVALGESCGSRHDPCYIEYSGFSGLPVNVQNRVDLVQPVLVSPTN